MSLVRTNRASAPVIRRSFGDDFLDGMNRFFDDFPPVRTESPALGMDLFETEEALVLELAVPGLSAEEIDVSVEGRQLTVRADLPEVTEGDERRYWLRSMPRGTFTRNVRLPASVATDDIKANVSNGVLRLHMPKVAEAKVRRIEVAGG